jgi:PEP-CTERM motif
MTEDAMNRLSLMTATLGLLLPALVGAADLPFSGTFANTNPPGTTGGRCAGATVTIGNFGPFFATGTSNLGSFTASQSHCLSGGPPIAIGAPDTSYFDGRFTYTFAGGALSGTYTGLLSNAGTTGAVTNIQNFTITGGTGRFADASGSFLGTGQLRFGNGPPSATLEISRGVVSIPAVPEPATWTMLILGFAGIGTAFRRRRAACGVPDRAGRSALVAAP